MGNRKKEDPTRSWIHKKEKKEDPTRSRILKCKKNKVSLAEKIAVLDKFKRETVGKLLATSVREEFASILTHFEKRASKEFGIDRAKILLDKLLYGFFSNENNPIEVVREWAVAFVEAYNYV